MFVIPSSRSIRAVCPSTLGRMLRYRVTRGVTLIEAAGKRLLLASVWGAAS
jgi:hypothetical protein